MKILKYGEGYPKTATCGNCQSVLQYELNDIHHKIKAVESSDPLVSFHDTDISYIMCPVCGEEIVVDSKIIETYLVEKWW